MLIKSCFFSQISNYKSNNDTINMVAKYGVGTATRNQINGTRSGSIIYSNANLITKNILKIRTIIMIKVSAFITGFIIIIII